MPVMIKIALSTMVALAAIGGWIYMGQLGQTGPQWAIVFLGPFSVASLWIFPEVMRSKSDARSKS
ncbi:hypothetical protein AB0T83_19010 [Fluviibacterium sp. DFM31]|uniref:DUF2842 domain-containing protein n=1 Tax=Meridianimarinicoccus marinus TaxID=3231483 RepID=A0ABV3LBB3_9RHOB